MTNLETGRQGISRTLSTRLAAPDDLDAFSRGLTENYIPKTGHDYATYRRYMHDILVLALLECGIYSDEELTIGKLGLSSNVFELNNQRPDLYTFEIGNLEVGEVLLSYNFEHEKQKKNVKYQSLLAFIASKIDVQINFNVIGVDLTDPEWPDALPRLPPLHFKMLSSFIDNLRYIHSNSNFASYRSDTSEFLALDKFRFELSKTDLPSVFSRMSGGDVSLEDLIERIEGRGIEQLSDEDYLELLADGIIHGKIQPRPAPHPEPSSAADLKSSWEEFSTRPKTTDKLPRVLQLGSPAEFIEVNVTFEQIVQELRATSHHGGYLDMIKAFLQHSDPDDNRTVKLSLSDDQLQKEQMEGPGRKSLIRKLGLKQERKPPTHISISQDHEMQLDQLIQTIEDTSTGVSLRDPTFPDPEALGSVMETTMNHLYELHTRSPHAGLAKFYQRLSQEIVINSMRRRKNRQYVICGTGFRGVFCLIAPGAQLRTESNTEFIKIVSFIRPIINPLSAPWLPVGDHWESEWLSVDTDRLKHWSRSFDRTLISSVACAERLVEPGLSLQGACRSEIKTGNYQLMVLTYLEDKQLTSLTNQTIRYLWMKALGDKQFSGIMRKFPSRVGSVIQSTMLQRAYKAVLILATNNLADFISISKARQDDQTGAYDETTTGIVGKLPRLITKGGFVPIAYNLNEIYWCMMYNKDRQNPAQDALSILDKVLKEEEKYDEEIARRKTPTSKLSYIMGNTTVSQDISHIKSSNPESHYFSRRAVQVGMKLQARHPDNVAPDNSWRTHSKINQILSKNLSEFATFKASVKTICHRMDNKDLKALEEVGKRTKAVELVAEIVRDEKLTQAFQVAMTFSGEGNKDFDVMIQIFKKGQIGGIREIMILYIKARILFNIVEEVCRLLSKSDKTEILTKGKDKRLMMRGDYEEVLSLFEKGAPVQMVKNSYDMTTWAQKYIPTIFCSIYTDLFRDMPHMKNLAYFIFLKHTNKMIEYPRKLTEMWMKHPDERHDQRWLQKAKDKFLSDGVPYFRNHSNMCQGIPHYNSTVLALSCQSLRDKLFEVCLKQLNQECRIRWKTRVGSDDKGDMIGIDMSYPEAYAQYMLFEQCAHAAERLHSMELSVKSAAGNVIYELNSAFMANLETLSPTIKFSLAACDMVSTSSCSVFVNEAYGRVRQLRENGGSSVLCGLAHILNMDHFTQIFRTGKGMTNDVESVFQVGKELIPYDFGVYPFYDVDLQDIVGPEFHNYLSLTNSETPMAIKQLLFTPLTREEIGEAFPDDNDHMLLKKDHFGIRQGLVKQLASMRRRLGIDPVQVDQFFQENPFLLIRGPETVEESLKVIESKLLTKGAAEALRRTSPAIYLGRLSAFETAKAWEMRKPNGTQAVDLTLGVAEELEDPVKVTYSEFLKWGLLKAKEANFPVDSMLNVIFPQKNSFEVIKQFVGKFGLKRESGKKFSQAVRTWVVNNFNYNFNNSLKSILETSFGLSQLSSKEDVNEFRSLLNFDLSSYDNFLSECREKHVRPMDLFFYMTKIYKNSQTSKIQAFANGPSTQSLHNTLISLKRFSHLPNNEMVVDLGIDPEEYQLANRQDFKIETLKFCCNLKLMESQGLLTGPSEILSSTWLGNTLLASWCQTTIRTIRSLAGFDFQTKKVIIYLATQVLPADELKEKLLSWNTLNYTYLKKQKRQIDSRGNVSWSGDLEMLVNAGKNTFNLLIKNGRHSLLCREVVDHETLLMSLNELCGLLGFERANFFTNRRVMRGDLYLTASGKRLDWAYSKGAPHNCLNIIISPAYKRLRLQDLDSFKVVSDTNEKTGAVFVTLKQRDERTATLCHFPGNYYPASCPKGARFDESFWFRGIRLSRIMSNEDWFYNYRLPSLTDRDCTGFFRNDVNFEVVLAQTSSDKGRIVEYLQVMDEIDEEVFNINRNVMPMAGTSVSVIDYEALTDMDVNQLFMAEMSKIKEEGPLTFAPIETMEGMSWADMMDQEEEEHEHSPAVNMSPVIGFDEIEEAMANEEDGIRFVRAMGYKRRARKANTQIISQMQLGHLMKERVLNLFFKNGAVTSEERRLLPHYYIWLREHKAELGSGLATELQRVVTDEMQIAMGATKEEITRQLDVADSRLQTAPPRAMNFLYTENQDLFTMMSQTIQYEHQRYEESEGSEF